MAISDIVRKGSKSYIYEVTMRSGTTGQLLTGLSHASMTVEYQRQGIATNVTVVLVAGTLGVWASGSWVETDSNGVYQFGVPDAAIAAGVDYVVLTLSATGALDRVVRMYLGGAEFDLGDEAITGVLSGTLGEITLDMAREVTKVLESIATGGSATTLEDTTMLTQADEHWEGGTVWLKETGETAVITSFATNTLTIPTQSEVPTASDRYAVSTADYPLSELVKAVNLALSEMGPIISKDETLVVDSDVMSYDIPAGVSRIFKVKIVDPDDETIFYWSEHWEEEWWDGYTGKLSFDAGYQPESDDYKIVLYYKADHPELSDATDLLSPAMDEDRLKWMAIVHLLKWAYRQYGDDSRKIPQFLEDAIAKRDSLSGRRNLNSPVVRVHVAG